jgi:hypothetical protein
MWSRALREGRGAVGAQNRDPKLFHAVTVVAILPTLSNSQGHILDNQSRHIYLTRMTVNLRKIEVDTETADLLEARAAALGISVAALLAEIAANEIILPPDLTEMRAKGE